MDKGQTKKFSLIGAPAGAAINATSGVFNWTPTATGSYTFTVRVTDNGSPVLYDEEQITVMVTASFTYNNTETGRAATAPYVSVGKSSLYPNPVTDRFTVKIEYAGNCTIQIVDIKGTPVLNRKYERDNNAIQVEAGNLAAGQYILRILMESGETETLKFMKM